MSKKKKKKQSKDSKALRVDHTGAMLPTPSNELIEEMAIGLQLAVASHASLALDMPDPPTWQELRGSVQDAWKQGARIAYSVIAIHGGARLTPLPEPDAE